MNRFGGWLLTVPLILVGLLAGHSAGYWLAFSQAHERAHTLDETGHAYLAYVPTVLAIAAAVILAAVAAAACSAYRGRHPVAPPPLALAVLSPLAFVIQEHAERLVEGGAFPWTTALEPAFVYGLVLQLPFALLALAVGAALAALAASVGRALAGGDAPTIAPAPPRLVHVRPSERLRTSCLARGYSGRAPPLLAVHP